MVQRNVLLHDALFQYVFKFSIAKFRKQFTKYWGRISTFAEGYKSWKRWQLPDFIDETKDNLPNLTWMCRHLETCSNMLSKLEQDPKDEESLKRLISHIRSAHNRARKVLVSRTDCEIWASRVSNTPGSKFSVWFLLPIP